MSAIVFEPFATVGENL